MWWWWRCGHLQLTARLLAWRPSAFPVPSEHRLTVWQPRTPFPPRERIIPPLCRPRYQRRSNKAPFHTQTPRGWHRADNTAAETTVAIFVPLTEKHRPAAWPASPTKTFNLPPDTLHLLVFISAPCCSQMCYLRSHYVYMRGHFPTRVPKMFTHF